MKRKERKKNLEKRQNKEKQNGKKTRKKYLEGYREGFSSLGQKQTDKKSYSLCSYEMQYCIAWYQFATSS